jgi:hypothetical protein
MVEINPAIKRTENKFTPKGVLLPTVQSIGRETTDLTFNGQATFQDLQYFLKDVVSDAQTDPLSYTVEAGGLQIPGAVVTGITLSGDRDVINVNGTMIGKKATVATPTAGLVVATQVPILAPPVTISIGGTNIAKFFSWELSLSDMWGGATYIGSDTYGAIMQKAINGMFKVKFEADETNMAWLEETDTKEVIIQSVNGANSLTITFDAKFGEPGSFSDEEGIYAIELNMSLMNKSPKAVEVVLVAA